MINLWQALVLGTIEGITEFLPVSSTGHLIVASAALGLHGEAVNTFEVVIQAGAVAAVAGLYRAEVWHLCRALWTADGVGRRLWRNLLISVAPAVICGAVWHDGIKTRLFGLWPVVLALAIGGVLMIGVDWWVGARNSRNGRTVDSLTPQEALVIGLVQCLALWPGTSRAMVTIVAGLLLGLPATMAAEYSFLLALPTLGAATLFDLAHGGGALRQEVGVVSVACGFLAAMVVAAVTIRGFVGYLTKRGLAPFGWYRIGLAAVVWWVAVRG